MSKRWSSRRLHRIVFRAGVAGRTQARMDGERRTPCSGRSKRGKGRAPFPPKSVLSGFLPGPIESINRMFQPVGPMRIECRTISGDRRGNALNYEELGKTLGLDFWTKAIGLFISASFFVGYVLLYFYYAVWWGFSDTSFSKAVCVAVMIWLVCVLIQAYIFDLLLGRIIKWIERSKRNKCIATSLFFLYASLLVASFFPYVQRLAHKHQTHLSSWHLLAIFAVVLHASLCFFLASPISWLKELRKNQLQHEDLPDVQAERNHKHVSHIRGFVFVVPVLLMVFFVFSVSFTLIPARYGGGGPDLVELWMPRNAQSISTGLHCRVTSDNWDGCKIEAAGAGDEYLHYKNLYLLHEGSDKLILFANHCIHTQEVPKDFVKGLQWSDQHLVESGDKSQQSTSSAKAKP